MWPVLTLLAIAGSAVAAPAAATREDKQAAKAHYARAKKLYDADNYADARDEFRQAYDSVPEAEFLFNIGQCSKMLGDWDDASKNFHAFLEARPAQHAQVDQKIAEVDKEIADREARKHPVVAPKPVEPVKVVVAKQEPPPPTPRPKWFWPAIGGGAALVVILTIVIIAAAVSTGDAPDMTTNLGTMAVKFP